MTPITVAELCARFEGTEEFAVIDPREEGIFTRGHLLGASNVPLSRLELRIGAMVPRTSTEIVLTDDCDGTASRAEAVLNDLGYSNVKTLDGGLTAWTLEGFHLFSGVNIIGKSFGEYLEHVSDTPRMRPEDLKARLDSGEDVLLLDGRTPAEHSNFCIPGAMSCPNGEMVFRALPAITENTTVVVHCAGRTRSILGAQTLIDAGAPTKVYALENGTIDWEFAGLAMEHGAARPLEKPGNPPLKAAGTLAERMRVEQVSLDRVESWRSDSKRTLYLLDVRGTEEYAAGHIEGARHAPGGQLVQNVDRYLATRNARTVLIDDDGVRAKASAYWLARMGYANVFTLTATGTATPRPKKPSAVPPVSASDLSEMREVVVADIRNSVTYRRGHIAGAWYLNRAYVERDAKQLPDGTIVLLSDDDGYCTLVAKDLERLGRRVFRLSGGMDAWREAGGAIETGLTALASAPDDTHVDGYDLDNPAHRAREFRRYLDWEIGLIDMMPGDPAARWYAVEA